MKKRPPNLASKFFSWYCRNELHDSILGDLEEQFHQHRQEYGDFRANFNYWWNVFSLINKYTLRRTSTPYHNSYFSLSMIKNHFITSFRYLKRNKSFAFINSFGLTLGFTSFLLILLFVQHERSFDQFHGNKENIYRINFAYTDNAGNVTTLVNSPPALAPGISNEFPELEKISRSRYAMNGLMANGELQFYEDQGYYADSLFLEILQFEFLSGNPSTALDHPNSIVITESLANKYFNNSNPIGSNLLFNYNIPLQVTGILKDMPSNSHLGFNFLISFSTYQVPDGYASDLSSWYWLGFMTYVELSPESDPVVFEEKLTQFYRELDPENPRPPKPIVQNLSDIYLGSSGMSDDLASPIRTGNGFVLKALMIVAILILIIAGFNYSNLTHALSINRSRSSGIRKVLGADKLSIMGQLLVESVILTFGCLILAIGLTFLIFPYVSLFMQWDFLPGWEELIKLTPILLIMGSTAALIAGIFPAFVIANFDIVRSLKGSVKITKRKSIAVQEPGSSATICHLYWTDCLDHHYDSTDQLSAEPGYRI